MTELLFPQNNLQEKTGVFMICMPIEMLSFFITFYEAFRFIEYT